MSDKLEKLKEWIEKNIEKVKNDNIHNYTIGFRNSLKLVLEEIERLQSEPDYKDCGCGCGMKSKNIKWMTDEEIEKYLEGEELGKTIKEI